MPGTERPQCWKNRSNGYNNCQKNVLGAVLENRTIIQEVKS